MADLEGEVRSPAVISPVKRREKLTLEGMVKWGLKHSWVLPALVVAIPAYCIGVVAYDMGKWMVKHPRTSSLGMAAASALWYYSCTPDGQRRFQDLREQVHAAIDFKGTTDGYRIDLARAQEEIRNLRERVADYEAKESFGQKLPEFASMVVQYNQQDTVVAKSTFSTRLNTDCRARTYQYLPVTLSPGDVVVVTPPKMTNQPGGPQYNMDPAKNSPLSIQIGGDGRITYDEVRGQKLMVRYTVSTSDQRCYDIGVQAQAN